MLFSNLNNESPIAGNLAVASIQTSVMQLTNLSVMRSRWPSTYRQNSNSLSPLPSLFCTFPGWICHSYETLTLFHSIIWCLQEDVGCSCWDITSPPGFHLRSIEVISCLQLHLPLDPQRTLVSILPAKSFTIDCFVLLHVWSERSPHPMSYNIILGWTILWLLQCDLKDGCPSLEFWSLYQLCVAANSHAIFDYWVKACHVVNLAASISNLNDDVPTDTGTLFAYLMHALRMNHAILSHNGLVRAMRRPRVCHHCQKILHCPIW